MKQVVITGRCTKDAELRQTQAGNDVAGFSVAVDGFENGEKKPFFFDVSLWGKRGQNVIQFAKKGASITICGDLGTREYNGKTYLTINANDFTPGSRPADQSGQSGGRPDGYGAGSGPGIEDDDVPFNMEWRV